MQPQPDTYSSQQESMSNPLVHNMKLSIDCEYCSLSTNFSSLAYSKFLIIPTNQLLKFFLSTTASSTTDQLQLMVSFELNGIVYSGVLPKKNEEPELSSVPQPIDN